MFFLLSKILFFIIQPLVWIIALLIRAIVTKSSSTRKRMLIGALVLTYLISNEFIFNKFALAWENSVPNQVQASEHFEVAIVLGGISGFDNVHQLHTFNSNSERLLNVLPLYYSGRVEKILISGGSGSLIQGTKEAEVLKKYLLSIDVKEEDILIEKESRNTYENARNSVELLKEKGIKGKVLLSTSAIHMPRSYACFKKLDFHPIALPVDYISNSENSFRFDRLFIPQPAIINQWYWLMHEWLGVLSYKFAGYC